MWLKALWLKATYRDKPDTTDYRGLIQRAGEMTPHWDNRGVPDANDPEPPRAGFADDELRRVDPGWNPR